MKEWTTSYKSFNWANVSCVSCSLEQALFSVWPLVVGLEDRERRFAPAAVLSTLEASTDEGTMNPRLLIRKGRDSLPIIVEGEEPSSPSSFTKRFGFASKIRRKEPKSKQVPIQSRPHIVIRVESEDRSDRDSQSRHRPSASEVDRPTFETENTSISTQKESARQSPQHARVPESPVRSPGRQDVARTLERNELPANDRELEAAGKLSTQSFPSNNGNERQFLPLAKANSGVTFDNSVSIWDDDSQWVAFEDATFSSELQSRSSLSFFGADVFSDLPTATLSDQSLSPSLVRNGTNQSSRSQSRRHNRGVDVDELFKRDVPHPSSSLRASSFQSPSSMHPQSSIVSAVSLAEGLPPEPVQAERTMGLEEGEEEVEESEEMLHPSFTPSPVVPKSILRNTTKDRNSKGEEVGYVSEEDGVSDILGDYDPSANPEEAGALDVEDPGHLLDDVDQAGSTHAEDGSYDTTDVESDEDYDETEGNNGTDTEGGLEASDSFESATLLDIIGEAVIAIWEDIGPPEPKPSRRRSRPAHATKEREHRTRRTHE